MQFKCMDPTGDLLSSLPSSPGWKRVRESIQTWNETLGAVDVDDVGSLPSGKHLKKATEGTSPSREINYSYGPFSPC